MATYKDSGVDIEMGDQCSAIAYQAAKNTFPGRKGMIGAPVIDDGGFAGALDMGDYYLIQNDDGIGTKIVIAEKINELDTMGYDLLAMVVDDAICVGAEPISISNTLDVDKVDPDKVSRLVKGLEKACLEHKVVIPGGEIAELGKMVNGYVWNATSIGIVEKHKLISGEKVAVGDKLIALRSEGFRSNGFSLVRHILSTKFGGDWAFEPYDDTRNWGQAVLTPSKIFCSAVMELHGRYQQDSIAEIKGIVHVTGGGLPGNVPRLLKKTGLGARIDNLPEPHEVMKKLIEIGNVSAEEAYRTWNMGVGMILVSNDLEKIEEVCGKYDIKTQVIGEITDGDLDIKYPF